MITTRSWVKVLPVRCIRNGKILPINSIFHTCINMRVSLALIEKVILLIYAITFRNWARLDRRRAAKYFSWIMETDILNDHLLVDTIRIESFGFGDVSKRPIAKKSSKDK